jgi:transcriptional regulator with XRE-family HTH domain
MLIRDLRRRKNLNQYDIKVLTGINPGRLSLIENRYIAPTPSELTKLAKLFNVKPCEINISIKSSEEYRLEWGGNG